MSTLGELVPASYSFVYGEAQLNLRYDMAALLDLEKNGLDYNTIFAEKITGVSVLAFFRAGLVEHLGESREIALVADVGIDNIWEHCRKAVQLSLPEYDPLIVPDTKVKPSEDGNPDYRRLRTLVCDVMRKPDEFFWKSTLRELLQRWQDFAVAKGYAKPPERVQLYDTEGMD